MKELTGLILMAVLGTYYFCRKKTDRKKALFKRLQHRSRGSCWRSP